MDAKTLLSSLALVLVAACGSGVSGTGTGGAGATGTTTSGTTTSGTTTSGTTTSGTTGTTTTATGTGGAGTTTTGTTTGSTSSSGAGGSCATDPTFAEVLAGPLSSCSGLEPPCHNSGQAMLFINPMKKTYTWNQLVNVPTYTPGAGVRVKPGDPLNSFLYRKLINDLSPTEGSPMPKSGLATGWNELPADQIEMVRCWILGGAQND